MPGVAIMANNSSKEVSRSESARATSTSVPVYYQQRLYNAAHHRIRTLGRTESIVSGALSEPILPWLQVANSTPSKVHIILEELGLPFQYKLVEFDECKKIPFTKINPNGRSPAIEDPNTGVVLWEVSTTLPI